MARLPLFAALQAAVSPTERGMVGPDTPPRPKGTVVWAHCADAKQLPAVNMLARRLTEDGEVVTIIATLPDASEPDVQVSPNTKRSTRAFLDHFRPRIVLWVGGTIEAAPLLEITSAKIPAIFIEANSADFDAPKAPRMPRRPRAALSSFVEILTVNQATVQRLVKLGADPKKIRIIGLLEDGVTPPPHNEAERADLVSTLHTRPLWLAADVPMDELGYITEAHRLAERRAHRTLLLLVPRVASQGAQMAENLREAGFTVACRSTDDPPKDATQIYIADTGDGLGLWCRLSPITYLGGSLTDGVIPDPFAPATVGSAVLVGAKARQFHTHLAQLRKANALHMIAAPAALGAAVEMLLSADYAAQLAHAAWDVTSRGADATNELVTLIYTYLDQVNA